LLLSFCYTLSIAGGTDIYPIILGRVGINLCEVNHTHAQGHKRMCGLCRQNGHSKYVYHTN